MAGKKHTEAYYFRESIRIGEEKAKEELKREREKKAEFERLKEMKRDEEEKEKMLQEEEEKRIRKEIVDDILNNDKQLKVFYDNILNRRKERATDYQRNMTQSANTLFYRKTMLYYVHDHLGNMVKQKKRLSIQIDMPEDVFCSIFGGMYEKKKPKLALDEKKDEKNSYRVKVKSPLDLNCIFADVKKDWWIFKNPGNSRSHPLSFPYAIIHPNEKFSIRWKSSKNEFGFTREYCYFSFCYSLMLENEFAKLRILLKGTFENTELNN